MINLRCAASFIIELGMMWEKTNQLAMFRDSKHAFSLHSQVPIFEQVGPIYELRLMLDFSQSNRGYFFVRYTCKEDARKAVKALNRFEIRPRKFIGVVPSVDNRKLWVNGLPENRSAAEIKVLQVQGLDVN